MLILDVELRLSSIMVKDVDMEEEISKCYIRIVNNILHEEKSPIQKRYRQNLSSERSSQTNDKKHTPWAMPRYTLSRSLENMTSPAAHTELKDVRCYEVYRGRVRQIAHYSIHNVSSTYILILIQR